MHIPDGFLDPFWMAVTYAAAIAYAVAAWRRIRGRLGPEQVVSMSVLAAGIFVAQMLNWPLPGGTSLHFVGGALAGILFGPWLGFYVMALVLAVQTLVFHDGGITALGANVLNMAVVDVVVGYAVYRAAAGALGGSRRARLLGAFLGGYLSGYLPARVLRLVFSALLTASALLVARGVRLEAGRGLGPGVRRCVGGYCYSLRPLAAAAPVALVAFLAAMAGISGGSLIVPLLVLLAGVPLRVAIGTNPFLVLVSSTAGFAAHLVNGGFEPVAALVLAAAAVLGSQLGSRAHARLSDRSLRAMFSGVMLFAAAIMAARAL